MENNNLPEMTDEQRKAALERSAEARRERMEFKGVVKTGEISLADALADDRAKRIRVHEFLMCIPGIGKANLIRPDAGGCAEVVYDVLMALGVELTPDIAKCVYTAVSTDTGCFKFSNTVPHTLRVAAACLEAGVDGGEINRALFEVKSWPRFQMERIIFDTMEFFHDHRTALAILWRADIDRTGADMDDLDSIASLARQIEGVQIGITLTENKDGTVKASVRTTKEVDASAICRKCGGGGHLRAGGASFPEGVDVNEAKRRILQAAEEGYREREA